MGSRCDNPADMERLGSLWWTGKSVSWWTLFIRYVFGGRWPKDRDGEPRQYIVYTLRFLLTLVAFVIGCASGQVLTHVLPPKLFQKLISVLLGVLVTLSLGSLSRFLLETYVMVRSPYKSTGEFETEGGGPFLGFLERLIFYATFGQSAFIGGAWLVFKLGAKWSVWQHIVKYGESYRGELAKREQFASRLLGRFLNGTLWNAICGMLGAAVTEACLSYMRMAAEAPEFVNKVLDALK